jgi:hypothetical protein
MRSDKIRQENSVMDMKTENWSGTAVPGRYTLLARAREQTNVLSRTVTIQISAAM